jgi:hypothetical protein
MKPVSLVYGYQSTTNINRCILIVYICGMRLYYCIMTIKDIHMDHSKYDSKDSTANYVYLSKKGLSKYNHFIEGEQY